MLHPSALPSPRSACNTSVAATLDPSASSTHATTSGGKVPGATRASTPPAATTQANRAARLRASRNVSARATAARSADGAAGTYRDSSVEPPSVMASDPSVTIVSATENRPYPAGPRTRGTTVASRTRVAASATLPAAPISTGPRTDAVTAAAEGEPSLTTRGDPSAHGHRQRTAVDAPATERG